MTYVELIFIGLGGLSFFGFIWQHDKRINDRMKHDSDLRRAKEDFESRIELERRLHKTCRAALDEACASVEKWREYYERKNSQ